jgi:hypothetical protein
MPSHGKCRYCNDRNPLGAVVTSESAGHFQSGYAGQLDIHKDKIGKVRKR